MLNSYGNNLLIELVSEDEKSDSGFILSSTQVQYNDRGTIISLGDQITDNDNLSVGDSVIVSTGSIFMHNGKKYLSSAKHNVLVKY
jgi:co-chaperonin GroES (HSP10)